MYYSSERLQNKAIYIEFSPTTICKLYNSVDGRNAVIEYDEIYNMHT